MRSLQRLNTGQSYQDFLTDLAKAQGLENPTKEERARLDRKRKNKARNADWVNPHYPDARVTKIKDGRTHPAYKDEHAVDLDTGTIIAVTVQEAGTGDTQSLPVTLQQAQTNLVAIQRRAEPGPANARHVWSGHAAAPCGRWGIGLKHSPRPAWDAASLAEYIVGAALHALEATREAQPSRQSGYAA